MTTLFVKMGLLFSRLTENPQPKLKISWINDHIHVIECTTTESWKVKKSQKLNKCQFETYFLCTKSAHFAYMTMLAECMIKSECFILISKFHGLKHRYCGFKEFVLYNPTLCYMSTDSISFKQYFPKSCKTYLLTNQSTYLLKPNKFLIWLAYTWPSFQPDLGLGLYQRNVILNRQGHTIASLETSQCLWPESNSDSCPLLGTDKTNYPKLKLSSWKLWII